MNELYITSFVRIKDETATLNGDQILNGRPAREDFFNSLYACLKMDYPKFYKMDKQSQLGILAAEILIRSLPGYGKINPDERALVLCNSAASEYADRKFMETISDPENYFPSPSLFVYTLANIVAGEICIRNHIKGENAFFVTEGFNAELICFYISSLKKLNETSLFIGGWINFVESSYEAFIFTAELSAGSGYKILNKENLSNLYFNQ